MKKYSWEEVERNVYLDNSATKIHWNEWKAAIIKRDFILADVIKGQAKIELRPSDFTFLVGLMAMISIAKSRPNFKSETGYVAELTDSFVSKFPQVLITFLRSVCLNREMSYKDFVIEFNEVPTTAWNVFRSQSRRKNRSVIYLESIITSLLDAYSKEQLVINNDYLIQVECRRLFIIKVSEITGIKQRIRPLLLLCEQKKRDHLNYLNCVQVVDGPEFARNDQETAPNSHDEDQETHRVLQSFHLLPRTLEIIKKESQRAGQSQSKIIDRLVKALDY